MKRVGPASRTTADVRSTLTGRVVDTYTNIHLVKMFPHAAREPDHVHEAIKGVHHAYRMEMRNFTVMDAILVTLNGLLIVSVVGWAIVLWMQGGATAGLVAVATVLTLRLNAMTGWIMWVLINFLCQVGVVAEGLETLARPIDLLDAKDAEPLRLTGPDRHPWPVASPRAEDRRTGPRSSTVPRSFYDDLIDQIAFFQWVK